MSLTFEIKSKNPCHECGQTVDLIHISPKEKETNIIITENGGYSCRFCDSRKTKCIRLNLTKEEWIQFKNDFITAFKD